MADVTKININGTSYNLKDKEARTSIDTLSVNKANKTDVDNLKTETNNKLSAKYDASNIETGSGTLNASQSGYEGTYSYTKIHNVVTLNVEVKNISTDRKECYLYGLPFPVVVGDQKIRIPFYTNKRNLTLTALYDTYIVVSKDTYFVENETLFFTVTYLTN